MLNIPFYIATLDSADSYFKEGITISSPVKCGVFLCKSGTVTLSTDSNSYKLTPGCLYVYIVASRFTISGISDDATGIIYELEIESLLSAIRKVIDAPNILYFKENPFLKLSPEAYSLIDSLLTDLLCDTMMTNHESDSSNTLKRIRVEILRTKSERLVYEIIHEYFRQYPMILQPQDRQSTVFVTFLMSLFKNFREQREIAFYAGEQCLSTRYFSSIIKNKSGRLPSEIIENMVVGEAKQLLLDPRMSIKDVARTLNFPTQTFFGKYFKLRTGMSPKEFRQRNITDSAM